MSSQALSKDWEIFLSSNTQYPPENAKLTAVLKSIETTTVTENTTNWSFLAEKIQKESLFSQVIVTNSIPNKLFVSLKERTPIMTVFVANKKHLLSQNGDVYKSNFPQKTSNLVLLEGVFLKENKNRTFRPNNSLSLSAPERERIKKAINIYHMTTNKNLNLEKITYEKYRGFSILLKNEQLKAVLGNDFLEKKTNRLSEIIKKTGKEAYNIKIVELDYEGKAFIQKKEQTNLEKNLDF